jgi:Uma2 family endonuclease
MTAKPPPVPPRPFRFTREQYYEMGRLGYFNNARVELIYGEIIEFGPISWPHALCVGLVTDALRAAFASEHWLNVQQPFRVPGGRSYSEPQPDIAVIPGSSRGRTDHPTVAALLVEVSDATLDYDLTTKAELYATAGVPECWVLDVSGRQLHVFREPVSLQPESDAAAYRMHLILGSTDRVSPQAAPSASIQVSDLLP